MEKLIGDIRETVLAKMDLSREIEDQEIEEAIAVEVSRVAREMALSIHDRVQIEQQIFNSLRRLDAIQDLLDDPVVTEIMVNGPNHIFYEKNGEIHAWEGQFSSEERLFDVLQQIVSKHNRVINLASPIVDTRLEDGSRVNIVLSPISIDGAAVTIRKFPEHPLTMEQLIHKGAITEEVANFLKILVQSKYSILISGGTGSGKTTFLNALSNYISNKERIITIEDSAELQIQGIPNLVRLETRNSNQEQVSKISIRDLIKSALRMRPDRIIVGECRGAEAFDMLQAMNTGHDGSLSTGHANSCQDILNRLEMMVLMGMELPLAAIRQQIASGIDIIVQLGRLRDRSRRVLEIAEVVGLVDGEVQLNPLYCFQEEASKDTRVKGNLQKVGTLMHKEKMISAGFVAEQEDVEYGLYKAQNYM